jgi:phage/conjugal plasmid C-4 type zinc finger TraR family protein
MADDADDAQTQIDLHIAAAIKLRKQYAGVSNEFCEECEEPIPETRRKLLPGITLCVECAELSEKLSRLNQLQI